MEEKRRTERTGWKNTKKKRKRLYKNNKNTRKIIKSTAETTPQDYAKIRRESAGERGCSACVCERWGCSHTLDNGVTVAATG
jgi:hypothetical protein